MYSYQHGYHAGGLADVVKHTLLGLVLQRMAAKAGQVQYFETHAGRGVYPLAMREMNKTAEYVHGLQKVWPFRAKAPAALVPWLEAVGALNPKGDVTRYPGSPAVAAALLREGDALHLCEGHPQEFAALEDALGADARVHVYKTDGPRRVPTLLPSTGTRTVVLIDPSYEVKTEYAATVNTVKAILKRNPKAVVLVWYPLLPDARHTPLVEGLAALKISATYKAELTWAAPSDRGAYGTGQVILNLPYQLETDMAQALNWLLPVLSHDGSVEMGFVHPPA
ncbi:MAG: 23S rRNA (adenine(2030)-N(6))-methyltransferase RlmJ [Alphaproteobacteria bacterium]